MGKQTSTYPPPEQRERWQERADELDMSMSQFLASMVEAGMKKFERDVEPDFSNAELREQKADLQDELSHVRERMQRLEDIAYGGERQEVIDYIENNPGVEYYEILTRIENTAGERLTPALDWLETEGRIEKNEAGQYFAVEDADDDDDEQVF
jgi:hypothetical protein